MKDLAHLPFKSLMLCANCQSPDRIKRYAREGDLSSVVVLCTPCAATLIPKSKAHYVQIQNGHPVPGAMSICLDCRYRKTTKCTHPGLELASPGTRPVGTERKLTITAFGGVEIAHPSPHIRMLPNRTSVTYYFGPATGCSARI